MSPSKIKLVLLSLLTLFLLGIGMGGMYVIRIENEKTSTLLGEVNQVSDDELRTKSIEQVRESSASDIALFDQAVLTDEKIASAIEKIEGAARSLNLQAKIVSVDRASEDLSDNPQEIRLKIETVGSWSGSFSFLRAIESLPYKVSVGDASLVKSGSVWRQNLGISLYSFK